MESKRKDYVGNNAVGQLELNDAAIAVKASATVTLASAIAGDTVTINGLVYTGVDGAKADDTEFSIDTSDSAAATDLADSIDDDVRVGILNDVTATASDEVVTIVSSVAGIGGNETTIASSDEDTLAVSGAKFIGGANADIVYVNGLAYTPVSGAKNDDTEFSIDTSDNAAATDLADSIDDDVREGNESVVISAIASSNKVVIVGVGSDAHKVSLVGSENITANANSLTLLGLVSNPDDNNPTMKQVNFMNTPYSVQQTGMDKVPGRLVPVTTTAEFNALTVRTRVLNGSREGWISAQTDDTSLVFSYFNMEKEIVSETLTMAQVIASPDLFVANENY